MYRILIVEDHASMRDAIKQAFEATNRYKVVSETPSANFADLYCRNDNIDLVLMDVCTEGKASGLEAVQLIKKERPQIKIIVMTAFDEISYLPRAKQANADGFIYKRKSLSYFIEVADQVMQGKKAFPEKSIPLPEIAFPLTPREMEILRLMCKHMTSKEIAEELFITESTVKFHKANMLAKTGFEKSVDLAFYMISNGFINPLY